MTMLFDSHMHLNDERFLGREEEVVSEGKDAGVPLLFCAGYDLVSSRKAVELAERFPGVYAFVGFHPENLEGVSEEALEEIASLAKSKKVVGIGEIGLDYHWFKDPGDHEKQKTWFARQIDLANALGLPVSIHAREAYGDLLLFL